MNYKKIKFISVIVIYLIAFLLHFIYDLFPNGFAACFVPVNESVAEHLKMTLNSFLIYSIVEYFILKKKKIQVNNYIFGLTTGYLSCILSLLILYYTVYYSLGDSFISTQIIFIISIGIGVYINYLSNTKINNDYSLNLISILILLVLEFSAIYLTFNPVETELFIDKQKEKIGIYTYIEQK